MHGPVAPVAQPLLVGYFPQWALYDDEPYTVKTLKASGAAAMLNQLNYSQGFVSGGRCSVADPNADLNTAFTAESSVDGVADSSTALFRGNFHQLVLLKRMYPHLKVLISLEGHAADFAADAQPAARAAFVASCVDVFLRGNLAQGVSAPGLFDGIDVDWEYPRNADGANYVPLLAEFRRQMDALRPGMLLTAALGPSPHLYGSADVAAIGRLVDLAGLMTYDYNGPWSSTTGFVAPLSSAVPGEGSVQSTVDAWRQAGIPASKMLLGLPFYAYGWRKVAGSGHGLGGPGTPEHDDQPYRFIQALLDANAAAGSQSATPQAVAYRDPVSQAPWLYDGDAFWTYEDPVSIRAKAVFAADRQLAGFMVWELSGDTAAATLLQAAHNALSHPASTQRPAGARAGSTGTSATGPTNSNH